MKRTITILAALALAVCFAGCASQQDDSKAEPEKWTITFSDGDHVIETETVIASSTGASTSCPKNVSKDGFILEGWTTESADGEGRVKNGSDGESWIVTVFADGVTFTPVWEEGYVVTYEDGLGSVIERMSVKAGAKPPAIKSPTRDGYRFVRWDNAPETITADVTLTAVWEEIPKWVVTFTDGMGNTLKSETVEDGKGATAPSAPSRDGFTFDGWDAEYSNVTSDLTVNAIWKFKPTVGMTNALKTAQSYLKSSSFSYDGLVKQLEFEKYTHDEAVYGVDNCGANWNEQAAKTARSYLSFTSFSRDGLIDQLVFEGFTYDQSVYGADSVGL